MDADRAVRWLLESAPAVGVDRLPGLVMALAPALDASAVVVYVVDYTQTRLVPLPPAGGPRRKAVRVDGSVAGRAFATEQLHEQSGRVCRLWVPLVHGCNRLGVLEITTNAPAPGHIHEASQALAAAVTDVLISRRPYGDIIERVRRQEPMQLAAEIIWGLLPPLSFATDQVMVAGVLEPCFDIGGDAFDYALNAGVLSVAVFDAVGHGNSASLLATLAVGGYRNARRCGLDLADTARSVDKNVRAHQHGAFVSAVLAELDCATGELRLVVAGHPAPLLLRDGKMIKTLPGPTALPLGLWHMSGNGPAVAQESLQPGDEILIYTDGVIEARGDDGELFGTDRLVDFVTRALADQLPLPETMRRLVHAILAYQHDQLQDDATALMVQWRTPANSHSAGLPPTIDTGVASTASTG
ncbi:serine/threonine-protein phosphatase [Micromonospora sp. CPCC 205371]|nr:serine/threonine-protein phosphatase [Micromonospora sp. CPCC 205371]